MAHSTVSIQNTSTPYTEEETRQHDKCNIMLHKAELPIILLVSTFANMVATVTLSRLLQKLKSKNLLLLRFLAINDLFASVMLLISILANTFTCNDFRQNIACNILGWFGISSFGLSIYLIGVINLERMLMVGFPIFHYKHVTVNKIWISFIIGEGISLTLVGFPFVKVGAPFIYYTDNRFCGFDWSPWKQDNSGHALLVLFNALFLLSIILFIAFSNMMILISLRKRRRKFTGQSGTHRGHLASEKFALLTKVVGAINCLCNLPFFVKLVVDYVSLDKSLDGVEDSITSILLFCTPIINPFLYPVFNKLYRETLLHLICKVFHCQRCCKTSVHPGGTEVVQMESSNVHTDVTRLTSADRKRKSLIEVTQQSQTLQVPGHV